MTISRDTLSKSEMVAAAAIEDRVPLLVEARKVIVGLHAMIRRMSRVDLGTWLERARDPGRAVCQRDHEPQDCCHGCNHYRTV
jgi:hypothetical protein